MNRFALTIALSLAGMAAAFGQVPNHPIITEVYFDPPGLNDGPVGRDPGNRHQEYLEIYLPPAGALRPGLNKDALRLTFYEVEGDTTSTGLGLVNYRFDLPTFDLDPSNGTTPGAVARPARGVVVLGWVDYVGDPPTALAGTPSSRIALINGGVTGTSGFTFIAINGHHFGGTTNFPTLVAESLIDVPAETRSGVIQNGSGVYLLVDRDSPGYVELFDDRHVPAGRSADPNLPAGTVLRTEALLDAFAANDHDRFDVEDQPYDPPTGEDIDLETVLPLGGAFSRLAAQVPEVSGFRPNPGIANGYARVLVDVAKTTENGDPNDDDPVADALNAYRHVRNDGPCYPTPGFAALTTSPARLGVAAAVEQFTEVLADTVGRAGVMCANAGGDFGIDLSASGGVAGDPQIATFGPGDPVMDVRAQSFGFPPVVLTPGASAAHGSSTSAMITVTATNTLPGSPPIVDPVQTVELTATVLKPTVGRDVNGQPFQTTVFAAVQALVEEPGVANELRATALGAFLAANFGGLVLDTFGNGAMLIDPTTNLANPLVVRPMVNEFPGTFVEYITVPGAAGTLDLVQTILTSAEVLSGADTYDETFDLTFTAVKAISVDVPETDTSAGTFSPTDRVHFANARGFFGDPRSGLTDTSTSRTFEVVLVDTNVRLDGTFESGATDDFGIVVEIGQTEPGAPVVTGEFVFLSLTGGRQGADIDTLDVPPVGPKVANLIYLDLDNLHTFLGVRSIQRYYLIDAGFGTSEADIIEAFSLNVAGVGPTPCTGDLDGDGDTDLADLGILLADFGCVLPGPCSGDLDNDGDTDLADLGILLADFGCTP